MKKQLQIFLDFLRFCIGSAKEIPDSLKEVDWKEQYAIAKKQCLVGVLFDGIKKLSAEHVGMKKELLLQWMAESQMLEKTNVRLNDAAIQVSEWFRKKEFRTCVLKGQGNALMYPNPYSRTPGDIDIWVEGGDKRVISFVRSISPHEKACYHHIEFPSYKGVEVEVHYRPSFLLCFWHNRKLQKYYERVKEEQFSHRVMLGAKGEIAIPTAEFNLIFQLTHIFTHLMNEGIGLRQLLDYFFVLKNTDFSGNTDGGAFLSSTDNTDKIGGNVDGDGFLLNTDFTDNTDRIGGNVDGDGFLLNTDFTDNTDRIGGNADGDAFLVNTNLTDRRLLQDELRRLGLWKFAGAVMYIMKEVFGLEDNLLIAPLDVKRGRFVLNEVLEAGNFGKHDARNRFGRSQFGHNLQRVYRDIRLVRYFPAEALSEPIFRTWHFFWRCYQKM